MVNFDYFSQLYTWLVSKVHNEDEIETTHGERFSGYGQGSGPRRGMEPDTSIPRVTESHYIFEHGDST